MPADWYVNLEAIEAPEPYTVVFKLKRPQPSLLLMLASGYSPVYPAHVPLAELRSRCVGTGPFKLKEYARGQHIELERNRDYFIPDRPYLDGVRYPIISERGTRLAALQAGRLDVAMPIEMTKVMAETVKKNVQRGDGPAHGSAVTGAGSSASSRSTWPAPCSAGATNTSPSALREEPHLPPLSVQLQPHAGRVDG